MSRLDELVSMALVDPHECLLLSSLAPLSCFLMPDAPFDKTSSLICAYSGTALLMLVLEWRARAHQTDARILAPP